MYCFNCGAEVYEDDNFCPYCGQRLKDNSTKKVEVEKDIFVEAEEIKDEPTNTSTITYENANATEPKSGKDKLLAGILAITLGDFGVHNFYMGRIARGVLGALFWWTCIPGIIGFIEGIVILLGTDEAFEKMVKK